MPAQFSRQKALASSNDEGSGDDSDVYVPPHDDPDNQSGESEAQDHVDGVGAKVGRPSKSGQKPKNKTSARTSIAAVRFTSDGVSTPSLPAQALPGPSPTLSIQAKIVTLKRKAGNGTQVQDGDSAMIVVSVSLLSCIAMP